MPPKGAILKQTDVRFDPICQMRTVTMTYEYTMPMNLLIDPSALRSVPVNPLGSIGSYGKFYNKSRGKTIDDRGEPI